MRMKLPPPTSPANPAQELAGESGTTAAILRAVLRLARRLRAERPAGGVSLAGIGLLSTLHRRGPMPAARLAEAEGLQAQSLTRLLAQLERTDLIARTRAVVDRRERIITLTPRGREMLARDMRGRETWLSCAMAEALTASQRHALGEATTAMILLAEVATRAGAAALPDRPRPAGRGPEQT